jgi:uncharacterized membrane protein YeaQ/YmgE (transglycosylase-associated protein family)
LKLRLSRAIQLPIVIVGALLSALIVFAAGWAINGPVNLSFWSLLPAILGLAIVLICVFVRLR